MTNCKVTMSGTKLLIEIDASPGAIKAAAPSRTGKTRLLATTSGAVPVDGHPTIKVALNVMIPL